MNKLWFENCKQFRIGFFVVCMAFFWLTGCQSKKEKELQGISEENIWCLSVESFDEETSERKIIDVDINDRKLVVDDMETTLSEEQCKELQELIFTYSYQVLEQEYDYWPHTEEYPEMLVLFQYKVYYGEEKYSADGALCYPDGWEEFLKTLEGYAQAPNKQMENTFEILLPPNGEIKYTTEELNIIADALDGDINSAENLLKQLNEFGIYDIQKANMIDKENMEIVNKDAQCFILWLRLEDHIGAIQRDNKEGEFIYKEVE